MAELEFYYTPPGGSEATLVKMPDVADNYYLFKGMQGFGMPTLEPAVAQRGDDHGGVYVGEQPRAPERIMTLSLGVVASTYSAFWTKQAALSALVTPFVSQQSLGKLRIVKPNSTTRCINCLLIDDPMDSGQKDSLTSAIRHLQFWAPQPWFWDPTLVQTGFDTGAVNFSGLVAPMCAPLVCEGASTMLQAIVVNVGTAKAWPKLYLIGPASYPKLWLYQDGDHVGIQFPFSLATGDILNFDMETGISEVTRVATGRAETFTRLRVGSERWQLEPGTNIIYLSAGGLLYSASHKLSYYAQYVQL